MRILIGMALAVGVLMLALGQGGAPGAGGAAPVKVGLLVTGSTSDGGWNQLAADSLNKLAKTGAVQVSIVQQVSKDQAADRIRQFAARNYGLIIAHGYEYLDVVKEITNPGSSLKINIAVSGGDVDSPAFQSLFYDLSGASYQIGIIAGKLSKTGKLGFVGGAPFPTVTAMLRGFEAGAKSVNPNVTVAAQYTGWDDPAKAKKQVEAFIADGVDMVMQNVDAASSGVFEAVKEQNGARQTALRTPVYTFGANSDQNDNPICPDYTLASAVIKMDQAFDAAVKEVQAGKFKGGLVKEDIANGVAVAVVNPKLSGEGKLIDPGIVKLLDEAAKKIASGEVKIPGQ